MTDAIRKHEPTRDPFEDQRVGAAAPPEEVLRGPHPNAEPVAAGWHPIDERARTGELILAANSRTGARYVVGWTAAGDWDDVGRGNAAATLCFNANFFDYWMPLPLAPGQASEDQRSLPETEAQSHNDLPSGEGAGVARTEAIKLASRLRDHAVQLLKGGAVAGLLVEDLNAAAAILSAAGLLAPSPDIAALRKAAFEEAALIAERLVMLPADECNVPFSEMEAARIVARAMAARHIADAIRALAEISPLDMYAELQV